MGINRDMHGPERGDYGAMTGRELESAYEAAQHKQTRRSILQGIATVASIGVAVGLCLAFGAPLFVTAVAIVGVFKAGTSDALSHAVERNDYKVLKEEQQCRQYAPAQAPAAIETAALPLPSHVTTDFNSSTRDPKPQPFFLTRAPQPRMLRD
jgi:hypothetical protein